jgi:hypothetical protein
MGVDQAGRVPPSRLREAATQSGPEAGASAKGRDGNALPFEAIGPGSGEIQATDGRRELLMQAFGEIENEPFGAAGIEAEQDV